MNRLANKRLTYLGSFSFGLIFSWLLSVTVKSNLAVASTQAFAQITPALSPPTSQVDLFEAIVLGFVQGMTEFIPISSTAHLKAVPVFLGWGDPGVTFSAVIQLGSIAAVLWYFWQDWMQLFTGTIKALQRKDYEDNSIRMSIGIIVGTLPIVILGLAIKIFVPDYDNSPLRSMTAIAIASIVMALLLALAERIGTHKRDLGELKAKDGILMGIAQALAVVPGVSRSGSTVTAGLFINLERATAARFSFLLGTPAITIAGLVELKDALDTGLASSGLVPLVGGLISAAVFSYLAIAWLIKFLQRRSTWVFVWYRLGFGVLILGAIALGWLSPS